MEWGFVTLTTLNSLLLWVKIQLHDGAQIMQVTAPAALHKDCPKLTACLALVRGTHCWFSGGPVFVSRQMSSLRFYRTFREVLSLRVLEINQLRWGISPRKTLVVPHPVKKSAAFYIPWSFITVFSKSYNFSLPCSGSTQYKQKGKGHPWTGTESLYRPYDPQGE